MSRIQKILAHSPDDAVCIIFRMKQMITELDGKYYPCCDDRICHQCPLYKFIVPKVKKRGE